MAYIRDLHELLRDLKQERFYGTVEVKFEQGLITCIKKTEYLKLLGEPQPVRFRPERETREQSSEHSR